MTTGRRKLQRVTYPTGYTADRWEYVGSGGRLRISVERTVRNAGGFAYDQIGDVTVTGTLVPRGASGIFCHHSLPLKEFPAGQWGRAGAVKAGRALARKWMRQLADA